MNELRTPAADLRRLRQWAPAALVLAALIGACIPGADEQARPPATTAPATPQDGTSSDGPEREAAEEPAPDENATGDVALGDPLSLEGLPRLPDEGVVVEVDDALVFVGLDGTVHGHLRDATLERVHGLQHAPPGLVPAAVDGHGAGWVDPAAGTFWPAHWGTPLLDEAIVLLDPHAGAPDAHVIHRSDEPVAQWDRDAPWRLSSGHRTVTWADCPDGADDRQPCPGRGHDLDMGADLDLDPGCWIAQSLGEFAQLRVCTDHEAEPRSWLELGAPAEEPQRYELPRPPDMPDDLPTTGQFLSAELAGEWILAQVSMECEVRKATFVNVDTGEAHPIFGKEQPLSVASVALGWVDDGRAAVLARDSACADVVDAAGVWLTAPDSVRPELLYPLPADTDAEAHLWRPVPGIELDAS